MEKDIENLIEELTKVRPEMLNEEALKLFNTIMLVLDERDKLREENKQLKARLIQTHNKVSDEEKAKLFDVIDNSIDTYLEQVKPYWEQIMIKEKMTIEDAETIIDDMYQERNKIISTKNDKGVTIHLDKLDDIKFTNLEFASVRALREIQSLRRKLENSIPNSKIKEKIEEQLEEANDVLENGNYLDNFNGNKNEQKYYYDGYKDATLFIAELMEDK